VSRPPLETVRAWHEALNGGDTERLLTLSHPDIEVGGPRGAGNGSDLLLAWVERANVTLQPLRYFEGGETVVAEEAAEWSFPGTDEPRSRSTVASVFTVSDGVITSVIRHDGLPDALRSADLDASRETGVV
jgi:hypothetical protein